MLADGVGVGVVGVGDWGLVAGVEASGEVVGCVMGLFYTLWELSVGFAATADFTRTMS